MNTAIRSGAWLARLLTAAATAAASAAHAADSGCSRAIEVPMAPIGLSVNFDGERAGGLYPALLRELSARTGCEFRIRRVPRARLQRMFESGQADLLIPASASPSRDADGEFVPLIQVRAGLVTLQREWPLPRSLAELIAQPDYKVAIVRGFSFGAAYDNAVATLRGHKRLVEEADAAGVARALRLGLAQASVMAPSIFISTLVSEPDLLPLLKQAHIDPLDELGWSESGLYLSRHSLNEADRKLLRQVFTQTGRTGRVWQLFEDNYPPGSLGGSIRPLP